MNKILSYLLLLCIGLLIIYYSLCYFGPKNLEVSISDKIEGTDLMIFNQINDFNNWQNWSPWSESDSTLEIRLGKKSIGLDATYMWSSQNREGRISIIESISSKYIKTKYTVTDSDEASLGIWEIESLSKNKTKLSLNFKSLKTIPFFARGYRLVTGSKFRLKQSLEYSLEQIKSIVEKQYNENIYNGYKVNNLEIGDKHYLIKRSIVDKDKAQQFYAQNLGVLFQMLQKESIEMNGMPCGIYFDRNNLNNKFDMAAGIPTKNEIAFDGISNLNLSSAEVLQLDYYGNYNNIDKAHLALQNYVNDNGLFINPPIIEEYITDPTTEKDSNKWLTKITYYYSR